jgi:dTDP-glucose 4,6-dehydratase
LAKAGEKIPIYGDGSNVRDWIYVKDHCMAILKVLDCGEPGSIYNIAGDNEISNIDVVDSVFSCLGIEDGGYHLTSDRPGHDWRYSIDDKKLKSLGWSPQMSFEKGLEYTVEWYGVDA